jgi:hypothetical protein
MLRGAITLTLTAAVTFAAPSDVDIHVFPRIVDASQPQNIGHRVLSEEHWQYLVTIENKRFQPLLGVEVRYMTFFTTAALGSKEAPRQEHENGSFAIEALQPHEKKVFTTNPVDLKKAHLVGHRYYINGGRIKAEDALVGLWLRVYQSGQLIGEYANPSTLTKEQWQ